MKELILRTLTGILLIILVAGALMLGAIPFLGMMLLVYTLGMRELFVLFPESPASNRWISALPGYVLLFLPYAIQTYQWSFGLLALPLALWIILGLIRGFDSASVHSLFWLATPLALYLSLGWMNEASSYQAQIPLAVISLLWVNDTFAYVSGRLFGKHKLTPILSPGKTWEGLLGGFLFSLVGGWLLFKIGGDYKLWVCLLLSTLVSGLSLWGDLFQSGLKRKRSVKNSGDILPGHGGILDRFDSLLFVAPGSFLLFMLLNLLT